MLLTERLSAERKRKEQLRLNFKAVLLVMVSPSALLQCVGPDYPQAATLFIEPQQHNLCGSQNKMGARPAMKASCLDEGG